MSDFWKGFLIAFLSILAVIAAFSVIVLVASFVNNVAFYDQLRLWFGSGSGFAKLFGK